MSELSKMRKRGYVWLFVGVLLTLGSYLILEKPLVVRGTNIPFGPVILAVGALILGWDLLHFRRERAREGSGPERS